MITRRKALLIISVTVFILFIGYFIFKNWRASKLKNKNLNDSRELIEEIAEIIIPATNSPGAKDAKVVDYILNVLENCTKKNDINTIISGLENLERYSIKKYSNRFEKCPVQAKIAVLKHFETKGLLTNPLLNKIKQRIWGQSFFEQMKWLTVSGYCQSKLGATEGLAYVHIPIKFYSCTPYLPSQKSWATK